MNVSRFIIKCTLISLIFSATQPLLAMNAPTDSRLKSFITSPKTVTLFGLVALGSFGYKTGNWEMAAGLMGTTFVFYKIFDYRRNMAWRAELEILKPKNGHTKNYDLVKISKATELLGKINDKKLNDEMSYWTYPAVKEILKNIIEDKNINNANTFKGIVTNLLGIINKDSLKTHVAELYGHIKNYNSTSEQQKKSLDRKIEEKYIAIKVLLI